MTQAYIVVPYQAKNNNMDGLKEFEMRGRSILLWAGLLKVILRLLRQWTFCNLLAFYSDVFPWIPTAYRPSSVNSIDCSQHAHGYHKSLETLYYMTMIHVVVTRHGDLVATVMNSRVQKKNRKRISWSDEQLSPIQEGFRGVTTLSQVNCA